MHMFFFLLAAQTYVRTLYTYKLMNFKTVAIMAPNSGHYEHEKMENARYDFRHVTTVKQPVKKEIQ